MAARQQQQTRGRERPWRLCLIRTYTDGSGAEKSTFLSVANLFRNEKGFTADSEGLHVDLRRGDRLALFPPNESDER